ncbi:MAG: ribosome maturation factor RimP [bacterium]
MKKEELKEEIKEVVKPIVEYLGLELFDLDIKKEGRQFKIMVYIDRLDGGVSVGDCQEVSNQLGVELDVNEIIARSYTLEVSSPGLDRPLRNKKDFFRFIGKKIKILTIERVEGEGQFCGRVIDCGDNEVTLEIGTKKTPKKVTISFDNVKKANIEVEF